MSQQQRVGWPPEEEELVQTVYQEAGEAMSPTEYQSTGRLVVVGR